MKYRKRKDTVRRGIIMLFRKKSRMNKMLATFLAMTMLCSMETATAFGGQINDAESIVEAAENFDVTVTDENGEVVEDSDISLVPVDEEDSVIEEAIAEESEITEEVAQEVAANDDVEIKMVSDNTISLNAIPSAAYGRDNTLEVQNFKATLNANYQVKLTWKKPKNAKGKVYYYVYKMNADGTFDDDKPLAGDRITTTSWVDKHPEKGPMVYMIRPEGLDKITDREGFGYNSYAIPAPVLVGLRRGESKTGNINDINIDIDYADLLVSENAINYSAYRGYMVKKGKKKVVEYDPVDSKFLVQTHDGIDMKPFFKKSDVIKPIDRITDTESTEIDYAELTYYKLHAEVKVNDHELGEVSVKSTSKEAKVTPYERAPRHVTAQRITGSTVFLSWEDMTGNYGKLRESDRLDEEDYYQLYYSLNGGALKAYKKLKVEDLPIVDTISANSADFVPYEKYEKELHIDKNGHYSTYCVCTGLKANGNYTFYVAPVRLKKTGAKGISNTILTEMNDITNLEVTQPEASAFTVQWDKVEGAASYKLYYRACDTLAEAQTMAAKWQSEVWETEADFDKYKDGVNNGNRYREVKVNQPSKGTTVSYKHKKLEVGDYYAYKVVAIYPKTVKQLDKNPITNLFRDNKIKTNINTDAEVVRLATPVVKVKESNGKVTFSWAKVKGAERYVITYDYYDQGEKYKEWSAEEGQYNLTLKDSTAGRESIDTNSYEYKKLPIGRGASIQVKAYTGSENDNIETSSRVSKISSGYSRPNKPKSILAEFNNSVTGPLLTINSEYTAAELSDTILGYKILRSYTGKKYTTINENFHSGTYAQKITWPDEDVLGEGKTVYYRIYSVATYKGLNPDDKDNQVLSKNYTEIKYCKPSSVSRENIKLAENDKAKDYKLSFKPKDTTVKGILKWAVSKKSDSTASGDITYIDDYSKSTQSVKSPNGVIKVTVYGNKTEFESKIKIEPLKVGKAYIHATTLNGKECTFKVEVKRDEVEEGGGDGKIIVLDPGHGGKDSGTTYNGLKEAEINYKISKYTKSYIEGHSKIKVYLTRDSGEYKEIKDRVKYAKGKGATAIISQHINSGSGTGCECYYSIDGTGSGLAKTMCSYTKDVVGSSRGAKTRKGDNGDYYGIIRYARSSSSEYGGKAITGVIMENAFIQNDYNKLDSDSDLKAIAEANAKAIIDYYS